MKKIFLGLIVLIAVVMAQPILSDNLHDEITCPAVIEAAMNATDMICDGTGRNQVCYGHILLSAQPQPGISGFDFEMPGSLEDVSRVQSLQLSPLETEEDIWGIALMRLQANLPHSVLEDVTLLVFGDVALENAVAVPTSTEITVIVNTFINVRRIPSPTSEIIGTLAPGQKVKALERLADQSWMRVELEDGKIGWVLGSLLSQPETPEVLNVSDGRAPYYRPMQAFYFHNEQNDTACPQQQTDGMLIQTPEGVGEITLLINEINIQIGSSVFLQAQAGGEMTVMTLEGQVHVTANGVTHTAYAGTQVTIPLTDDLKPAGEPNKPVPYDETLIQSLPIAILDRPIEPSAALTVEEIDQLIQEEILQNIIVPTDVSGQNDISLPGQPDCPGNSCNAPGQSDNPPPGQGSGQPDCPGNSCNAPGQSDNPPPGQGGVPPGQANNGEVTYIPTLPSNPPPLATNPSAQPTGQPPIFSTNPAPQLTNTPALPITSTPMPTNPPPTRGDDDDDDGGDDDDD